MKTQSFLRTLVACSLCFGMLSHSQAQVSSWDVSQLPVSDIYELTSMPVYEGGKSALAAYLLNNLQYPMEALERGVEGTVLVEFTIGKDGCVEDQEIVAGLGYGCDLEVRRLVEEMPCWNPGTINGKKTSCKYLLPVRFSQHPAL